MTLLHDILVHLTMLAGDYTATKELKHYVEQFVIYKCYTCYTVTLCHSTVVQGLNHVASVAVQHSSHGDIRDDKIAKFAICDRKCAA